MITHTRILGERLLGGQLRHPGSKTLYMRLEASATVTSSYRAVFVLLGDIHGFHKFQA